MNNLSTYQEVCHCNMPNFVTCQTCFFLFLFLYSPFLVWTIHISAHRPYLHLNSYCFSLTATMVPHHNQETIIVSSGSSIERTKDSALVHSGYVFQVGISYRSRESGTALVRYPFFV